MNIVPTTLCTLMQTSMHACPPVVAVSAIARGATLATNQSLNGAYASYHCVLQDPRGFENCLVMASGLYRPIDDIGALVSLLKASSETSQILEFVAKPVASPYPCLDILAVKFGEYVFASPANPEATAVERHLRQRTGGVLKMG